MPTPTPPRRVWLARLYATYLTARNLLLLGTTAALFVVLTALVGGCVEAGTSRVLLGLAGALLLPLGLRFGLRRRVARRLGHRPRLGGPWFLLACQVLVLAGLCLGFSEGVGRALRRRGDWFLGEVDGYLPRRYRRLLAVAGSWLERFDLPPELAPALAELARPEGGAPAPVPGGTIPPEPPVLAAWVHPLAGQRTAPPNAACRFGAPRPGPRPPECELGHCGVDLVQPQGSPVHAIHDGEVLKVVRDEAAGGIAGRFVMLVHRGGEVQSSYIHLEEVRTDLRVGQKVRGGEVIGTLGRTGIKRSGHHLHFALAIRQHGRLRYVDPERLLERWPLPTIQPRLVASEARYRAPNNVGL